MIFNKTQANELTQYVNSLFSEDKRVYVKEHKEKRTISQNSFYWLWLQAISRETGNETDDLHDFFAKKFLPMDEVKIFNKMIYKRCSTTTLTTDTFTQYLNKIQVFAAQQGITLPNPEDKNFAHFKDFYEKYL